MKKTIKTVKMGINGEGIGYLDRVPVFIKGALPLESVECDIPYTNGRYIKTKADKIIEKNPNRVEPECKYQEDCNCILMSLNYKTQLEYKKQLLNEALFKYAGIRGRIIEPFIENPNVLYYRNQCKLPIREEKGKLFSGLFMPESNQLIKINRCIIHDKQMEDVKKQVMFILNKYKVRGFDRRSKLGIRYIVIRTILNKTQVSLVGGKDSYSQELIDEISNIESVVSVYQNINDDYKSIEILGRNETLLAKEKYLSFNMFGLDINLLPQSFFQLNTKQTERLYDLVNSLVKPCNTIVEAYCGIGIMSMMLSSKAKKVIGIESVKSAILNAKMIAQNNNLSDKCEFICGDASSELNKINTKIDCLVVDPPRSGLDDKMIDCIIKKEIENIVYVSCNPSTLGKNIGALNDYYKVERVIPIDMFSNTPHVEAVVKMTYCGNKLKK